MLWAVAVDKMGGNVLAWIASPSFNTTVMSFILLGVCLISIDSGYIGDPYRNLVWERLKTDLRPPYLLEMTRTISFNRFLVFLKGTTRGRVVVEIAEA